MCNTIINFPQNISGSVYYIISLFCGNIPSDYNNTLWSHSDETFTAFNGNKYRVVFSAGN